MAASAATTLDDAVLTVTSPTGGGNYYVDEAHSSYTTQSGSHYVYTMTLVIDWRAVTENAGFNSEYQTVLQLSHDGNDETAKEFQFCYVRDDAGNLTQAAYTILNHDSNALAATYPIATFQDYLYEDSFVLTLAVTEGKGMLYTYNFETQSIKKLHGVDQPWYATNEPFNTVSIASGLTDEVNSVYIFNTTLGDEDVLAVTKAAAEAVVAESGGDSSSTIPEPTTATLSLLALAGLAARRRRK